ncbi:protein trichome birefringence-like 10 [Quercus suber]|uniref:Protein trichome birefringence-like 10 n=1 Tax=Quercus suber TaxID=58331 RepID=A0AAW0JPD1_QUESU
MSKNPSEIDIETMAFFEVLKRFKRLRLFEPSVGVLGFFVVTVCVICGFFYLDYRAVAKGFLFPDQDRFPRIQIKGSSENQRVEFPGEKGERCDIFEGDWVWDENYPLYQSKDCRFLDDGFRCSENGRPDLFYTKIKSFLLAIGEKIKSTSILFRGCYFQEGAEVKMDMEVEHAYHRSIETVSHWIHTELNSSKTQVFFRTYAPVHFRGGDWRTGGNCHLETLPELGSSLVPSNTWAQFKIANAVFSTHLYTSEVKKFEVLNVTRMTAQRKDGHSSLYYLGPDVGPAPIHRQDCSHWCLPGVPDTWNELLYALFLKREATHSYNASKY